MWVCVRVEQVHSELCFEIGLEDARKLAAWGKELFVLLLEMVQKLPDNFKKQLLKDTSEKEK